MEIACARNWKPYHTSGHDGDSLSEGSSAWGGAWRAPAGLPRQEPLKKVKATLERLLRMHKGQADKPEKKKDDKAEKKAEKKERKAAK
eukprot:4715895-Pyramimonas_sp.AAC.1